MSLIERLFNRKNLEPSDPFPYGAVVDPIGYKYGKFNRDVRFNDRMLYIDGTNGLILMNLGEELGTRKAVLMALNHLYKSPIVNTVIVNAQVNKVLNPNATEIINRALESFISLHRFPANNPFHGDCHSGFSTDKLSQQQAELRVLVDAIVQGTVKYGHKIDQVHLTSLIGISGLYPEHNQG